MAERRVAVIAFLLCCLMSLTPFCVQAASTSDASEPIALDKDCSLTLSFVCNGSALEGVTVNLYRIADVSSDFQYTLTAPFASTDLILNGIQSSGEWNVIRSTLDAYILANGAEADVVAETDSTGRVLFDALKPGLYLAEVGLVAFDGSDYFFDSALVALPGLGTDGLWTYQVAVAPKSEIKPPIETDEEVELKVLKLWKGDDGKNTRPKSVEVEIFKDGTSYERVILSKENNWSYTWSAKKDGASWTVIERKVPTGYTMTVEKRETAFVLTNTYKPKDPDDPSDDPETGDTANIMLYVVLMIVSGGLLIVLGVTGKRNRNEE